MKSSMLFLDCFALLAMTAQAMACSRAGQAVLTNRTFDIPWRHCASAAKQSRAKTASIQGLALNRCDRDDGGWRVLLRCSAGLPVSVLKPPRTGASSPCPHARGCAVVHEAAFEILEGFEDFEGLAGGTRPCPSARRRRAPRAPSHRPPHRRRTPCPTTSNCCPCRWMGCIMAKPPSCHSAHPHAAHPHSTHPHAAHAHAAMHAAHAAAMVGKIFISCIEPRGKRSRAPMSAP